MCELQGKGKAWFNMNVLFLSLFLFLLDQISKYLVRHNMSLGQSIEIIPNFFNLTYITNDGMAFGIDFPFGIFLFSALSIVLTIFLFYFFFLLSILFWKNGKFENVENFRPTSGPLGGRPGVVVGLFRPDFRKFKNSKHDLFNRL